MFLFHVAQVNNDLVHDIKAFEECVHIQEFVVIVKKDRCVVERRKTKSIDTNLKRRKHVYQI